MTHSTPRRNPRCKGARARLGSVRLSTGIDDRELARQYYRDLSVCLLGVQYAAVVCGCNYNTTVSCLCGVMGAMIAVQILV